ncbi:hypothetical protein ACSBL2_05385 [Pedobacter sp. AW31-3R]|uniref:hypothetical protein n=1 Tax=Pedobacter sp. AW31-3R TaxID=3445781 RepID=UPI003F9F666D
MRAKTIFIILITVLITVFLMMNTDPVKFDFIFVEKDISKLVVVGVFTFIGFILGYWTGRPKVVVSTYDDKFDNTHKTDQEKDGLTEEDREYIS